MASCLNLFAGLHTNKNKAIITLSMTYPQQFQERHSGAAKEQSGEQNDDQCSRDDHVSGLVGETQMEWQRVRNGAS